MSIHKVSVPEDSPEKFHSLELETLTQQTETEVEESERERAWTGSKREGVKAKAKAKVMSIPRIVQLSGICLMFVFLNTGACEEVDEVMKKVGGMGRGFGEECTSSSECSEKELLGCQNGLCTCSPSTSLLYEEDFRRCVARVGEKCGGVVRGEWSVSIVCPEGALCDESSGGCVCTDDFFRLPNGTCSRKRKYMESCKGDLECAKDYRNSRPLVCDGGHCRCDPRVQVYDVERRQCVTLVGGDCSPEMALPNSSSRNNECSSRASCVNGKCECEAHYRGNTRGQCHLGHGEACGVGRECSDVELACLDGFCECKFPLHQIYDEKRGECLSLVSGPCTLNQSDLYTPYSDAPPPEPPKHFQRCTKNAMCVDQGFFAGCECLDGFVQKRDGQCAPGYGERCEMDECDPITPLFCRNNRCGCRDELQMYDVGRRKCLGLVGSRCTLGVVVQQCVEFCSCIQVGVELDGKCLCDKYSEEVENRTCVYL